VAKGAVAAHRHAFLLEVLTPMKAKVLQICLA